MGIGIIQEDGTVCYIVNCRVDKLNPHGVVSLFAIIVITNDT